MSHLARIKQNINTLNTRAKIIRSIREFFWQNGFTEHETPLLLKLPGQEPYLSPMELNLHNEKKESVKGFLHTSPEYTLKKMLAAGAGNCFSICKTFRDYESFGGHHNPEFTLIEWYRVHTQMESIMEDTENLITHLAKKLEQTPPTFRHMHMKDVWKEYANIDLDNALTPESLAPLVRNHGHKALENEPYEDLFYKIFLNQIEPNLPKNEVTIIYGYPAQMAALSKLNETDPRYANRFEVYWQGMELANAFHELTDPVEQRRRLEQEKMERQAAGKTVFEVDENFIEAVGFLPPCAGIALGIDRLIMALLSCQNIDEVLVLPASKLFNS